MTILYLITGKPDPTLLKIIAEQEKLCTIETIDLTENTDYDEIVDKIDSVEKVISW